MTSTPQGPSGRAAPEVVSQGIHIQGDVTIDGDLLISGTVDGNARGRAVQINEAGIVRGDVCADVVQVYGRIEGDIRASRVKVRSQCRITGNIYCDQLGIEPNAHLSVTATTGDQNRTNAAAEPTDESRPALTAAHESEPITSA